MPTTQPPGSPPTADTPDHVLVADIARRSDPALAEAFRRYAPAIAGLARRVLGDEGLAQDVVQDVFVGLWDHPDRFDQTRGSLRTLLLTQAHGRSVDIIRTREARKRREDRVAAEPEVPQPEIDAEFLGIAQAEAVREALLALPDAERRVLQLTYFEGHTYRGAAAILGLPEGTVKGRIRSALRRLHDILAAYDDQRSPAAKPSSARFPNGPTR
jgi:RNA polymerase sigma-70 factor, ECF subfamily